MACFYCKGKETEGTTLHAMQLKNCVVVIKNVPCRVCENCGATTVSLPVAQKIEEIAKEYENLVAESKIIEYS